MTFLTLSRWPLTSVPSLGPSLVVKAYSEDIRQLLSQDGVIAVREHPELRGALNHQLRIGRLTTVLPGVYAAAQQSADQRIRLAAVPRWDPNAVLTHEAAAALSFWPSIPLTTVHCQVATTRPPQVGFTFTRGRLPPELVVSRHGFRLTSPALTALDLCSSLGGDAIDHALRARATTLELMHQAMELTSGRTGNRVRRDLLLDSRDEPWSAAERQLHRLLRAARITGWTSNKPVRLRIGHVYPDVRFRALRLVIEVDGREFHNDSETFESDRWRQNYLMLEGWFVLRLTWRMITDEPELVIAMIREAMALLATRP